MHFSSRLDYQRPLIEGFTLQISSCGFQRIVFAVECDKKGFKLIVPVIIEFCSLLMLSVSLPNKTSLDMFGPTWKTLDYGRSDYF